MNNVWAKLQGWKQTIALLYWVMAMPLIPMWFPNNQQASNISMTIGIVFSAIGMTSSMAKKYQEKITREAEKEV